MIATAEQETPATSSFDFYQPGPSIAEFHDSPAWVRFLIGGRGCLSYETPIYDPLTGENIPIGIRAERQGSFHALSATPSGIQICQAEQPFVKGYDHLWRVTLENGKVIRCAGEHRFLTRSGWQRLSQLSEGMTLACSGIQPQTNSDTFRAASCGEAIEWLRIGKIEKEESPSAYYDLTVPESGNYLADGVWHHNSGKTSAAAMDGVRHLWTNPGGKVMIVRKTEISNVDTTVETFNQMFYELGPMWQEGSGLFRSTHGGRAIRVPSEKAVRMFSDWHPKTKTTTERAYYIENHIAKHCGHIYMRGLPDAKRSENKLRGFECSLMILVEADLLELTDFQMAIPCIRWKGSDGEFITDGGVIVETNPPSPLHWIAKLEEETKKGGHPTYAFWHIKTEENAHNLRPGYVDELKSVYASNPAMYNRMVNGEYDEAFAGSPVMHAFKEQHAGEDLPWPKGAYLVRGWDFGTNNAVVWSAYWMEDGVEFWHDLYEQYLEGSDTDRQAREAIKATENEFPFHNDKDICAGVLDWSDPAGASSSYTRTIEVNGKQVKESPVNILRTYGITPGFRTFARGLEETLSICNRLMEAKDKNGAFVYRIDKKHCPLLYRGAKGGYRFPEPGETGYGTNQPLKGLLCGNLDHLQDAARYSKINCLKLIKSEKQALSTKPTFGKRRNPNPDKWRR